MSENEFLLLVKGEPSKLADKEFRNNKELVLKAMSVDGTSIKYISPILRADIDVVVAAVKNDSRALQYVDPYHQHLLGYDRNEEGFREPEYYISKMKANLFAREILLNGPKQAKTDIKQKF